MEKETEREREREREKKDNEKVKPHGISYTLITSVIEHAPIMRDN